MENETCIFCEIGKKNIQPLGNGTIWEDENFIAFLSPFPNTKGFTIVMPKKHFPSDVLKMPEEDFNDFLSAAKKVANILENYFEDVGRVGLMMEGTGINHAHIKLFPMHGTDYMKTGEWKQISSDVNFFFDAYPGYLSSNDGPKADFEELEKLANDIRNQQ